MNILAVNPFKLTNYNNGHDNLVQTPRFGLTMAKPLSKDTVSFQGDKLPTKKSMEKGAYIISADLAMRIQAMKAPGHERKKQLLLEYFGDLIEKGIITFHDRLKGIRSIREKATTNGWSTKDAILEHMDDISGFSFDLNSPKAFPEVIKRYKQMLEDREIEVKQVEYHRRAPKYKKNQIVESFDTLKPYELQRLREDINKIQKPIRKIWFDVDSRSGYSGLHSALRTKDDETSELQIMVRNMAVVKKIENLLYKIRNGKSIDPKYEIVARYLTALVPLEENASPEEVKLSEFLNAAMSKYLQEAYAQPVSTPFSEKFKPLKVEESETLNKKEKKAIAAYDLNKIEDLMIRCEYIVDKYGEGGMSTIMRACDRMPHKCCSTDIVMYLDMFERIIDKYSLNGLTTMIDICEKLSGKCEYKTIELLMNSYEKMSGEAKS
ncbi:MAG: hypothetical protein NC408_09605 [Candidatus Gastranaerophilales bacterium]|nr:hypothetical protein [Candidatus Gastranaerophilales bacterium]MCM1073119.1 hypothetical protein [Bacteroides sp.]